MNLNINYDQTRKTGDKIIGQAAEFSKLLGEIKQENENLKNFWKGDDATAYTGRVEEHAIATEQLKGSIDEIGNFLKMVADAYQKAMESNK